MIKNKLIMMGLLSSYVLIGCGGGSDSSSVDEADTEAAQQIVPLSDVSFETDDNSPLLAEYDSFFGITQLYGEKTDDNYEVSSIRYITDEVAIDVQNTENGQIISSNELGLRFEYTTEGATLYDSVNNTTYAVSKATLLDLGLSEKLFPTTQSYSSLSSLSTQISRSDVDLSEHVAFNISQCSQPFKGEVSAYMPNNLKLSKLPLVQSDDGFTYISAKPFSLKKQIPEDVKYRISNLGSKNENSSDNCALGEAIIGLKLSFMNDDVENFAKSDTKAYGKYAKYMEKQPDSNNLKKHSYGYTVLNGVIGAITNGAQAYDYATTSNTSERVNKFRNIAGVFDPLTCVVKGTKYDAILPEEMFGTLSEGSDTFAEAGNGLLTYLQESLLGNSGATVGLMVIATKEGFSHTTELDFTPSDSLQSIALPCRPEIDIEAPEESPLSTLNKIWFDAFWADEHKLRIEASNTRIDGEKDSETPEESVFSQTYDITGDTQRIEETIPSPDEKGSQIIKAEAVDSEGTVVDTMYVTIAATPVATSCGNIESLSEDDLSYSDAFAYCNDLGLTLITSSKVDLYSSDLNQCTSSYDWVWLGDGNSPNAVTAYGYAPSNGLIMPWGTFREFRAACIE